MKLRLADWSNIAEILSGIAVVITLVFLLIGIRDNTEIARVSMYDSAISGMNEMLLWFERGLSEKFYSYILTSCRDGIE